MILHPPTTATTEVVLAQLEARLHGRLLRPADADYDGARRLWNGMIDRRPAAIVQCTGAADVTETVKFARQHGLLVTVRGRGHNIAGTAIADDALMIDLSLMNEVWVDPDERVAIVQPGANWGDVDRETQVFGLATPSGIVSTTGIAGLTLGGGFGWLSRQYGFTSDNLLSVDLVTADGEFLTASETENADLFWGLRGGGGNFGIVTSFRYRLHAVGPIVMAGLRLYPMDQADAVLRFYRDFSANAPDELGTLAVLRMAPAAPFLPKEIHGQPVVGIAVCYAGSVEDGERVVQPLKAFGTPVSDGISPKPYTQHQTLLDSGVPAGRHYYWKSEYLAGISDESIATLVHHAPQMTSPLTSVLLFQLGGAIRRFPEDASAASHRDAAYVLNIQSSWLDATEAGRHVAWTREFWAAVRPLAMGGVYVNFVGEDEGAERVKAAYDTEKLQRLAALKAQYDPTNFFRVNQNIQPAR
ncbi:MAG: FAD-binding oxidoreductase [Anaerolineae bacterium]|nr:FAD-binding oxidoreductase [Anaerolineae bacterium]